MSKTILTITLSPAVDKSTSANTLVPEKKIRCGEPVFEAGGGGINIARAIQRLGGNTTAFYLGGGHNAAFFKKLLEQEAIKSVGIETINPIRENVSVLDLSSNLQYRFTMPAPKIAEDEWQTLLKSLENSPKFAFIVASGSIPEGVPSDIFARIAAIAKKRKAKFIIDTSGEALKQAVKEGVYLLKPNLSELSALVGKEELEPKDIKTVAQSIIAEGKCAAMVISMGAAGAMLVTKKQVLQIAAPPVKIKSTVGAGDSMVAGMVFSLANGKNWVETVQYGVACGTAATLNAGNRLMSISRCRTIICIN